ncbi:MAG TPA: class II glutamine amidotransferase, partial [Kofleriaceae bacterium]|nr:class II glutamine amidotransferase [Kofleriaceae bacterium]
MCRMFGMAAATPTSPQQVLCEAPNSLRALSREHADGWGIAAHDGAAWRIERSTVCAAACERYGELARRPARLAIAHVRKATVGATSIVNTHPFERDGFAFAHNGTIRELAAVVAQTAPEQLVGLAGDTDSERLFAFVRTYIAATSGGVTLGICAAVRALRRLGDVGAATFLMSCGERLYAYRCGRSLFTLARASTTMIASERLTDEPWAEVPEDSIVV